MKFASVLYPLLKSPSSFKVCIEPNSRTTKIYCSVDNGRPCRPCSEFSVLQSHTTNTYALRRRDIELRHQINDQHDLMNVLPEELRAEIFEFYCSSWIEDVKLKGVGPQIILLSVCKAWRDLAIKSPRLWATFSVLNISNHRFCTLQVLLWFQRSNQLPISLRFNCKVFRSDTESFDYWMTEDERRNPFISLEKHEQLIALEAVKHKDRIHAINIAPLASNFQDKLFSDTLKQHTIWPMLSHITLGCVNADDAVELLRCCPQAAFVSYRSLEHGNRIPKIVTSLHLKTLKVGFYMLTDPLAFFDHISAPALKELTCYQPNASRSTTTALKALFRRSACSLDSLHLIQTLFDEHELISLLMGQPSLRTLAIDLRRDADPTFDEYISSPAFKEVTRLLLTGISGTVGVGREYTTGEFLPCLEVIRYTGKMLWSWHELANICSSHTGIPGYWRRKRPANLPQPQSSACDNALSIRYRPLRLLTFLITEEPPRLTRVKEIRWRDLLFALPINRHVCRCRFECEVRHLVRPDTYF